jgi:phosphoribosylanthranilate isomerase
VKRTRVKICGITRERDARAAVRAGADALGFVFWPDSPRKVTPDAAARIGRTTPAFVSRVGVFVNAGPAEVKRIVLRAGLDAIQLHGDEDPADYADCGAAIIKAVRLSGAGDVRAALACPTDVTLLVDAEDPVRRGGTGRPANWKLARTLARARPILLAGGIGAANVRDALRAVRPWGIDVSSGVEVRPGVKSQTKIAGLFARVAQADQEAL